MKNGSAQQKKEMHLLEQLEKHSDNERFEFSNNKPAIGAESNALMDILESMGSLLPDSQDENYEELEFERQMKKKKKRRRLN